jgi:hypothetical protein
MFGFLFAFLGSGLFWIGYAVVSFFVGSILIKQFAPYTYTFITTGKAEHSYDTASYVMLAMFHMVFWQIEIVCLAIAFVTKYSCRLFFVKLFWPLFCRGVKASAGSIPRIRLDRE